ncbi:MAG: YbaB/EbfC family nucleoid-associated protein [Bacilli bacterium]|nr:YbaB/EbfC family nucleoid-associated protein [Bacilli bacterium]
MNMQNLMAQAQRMQRDIMKKKEEVEKQSFTGKSELVEITMNGNKVVTEVIIKNEDLTKDDIEVLQDMIMIATNNAIKNVDQAMEKAMGQYGSALNGLF